jgi:hypothetical protein
VLNVIRGSGAGMFVASETVSLTQAGDCSGGRDLTSMTKPIYQARAKGLTWI